jgi:FAD/FMN-containing dehydrogenase
MNQDSDLLVNDVHSQLNPTRVASIVRTTTVEQLRVVIARASALGRSVCISGGRHAMGGQQFADRCILVDSRELNRVLAFDAEHGRIVVEGGTGWPEIIHYLNTVQSGTRQQWGIYQKQTGADRLTIGGALSCNCHGRGLNLKPIVEQVEAFDLIAPDGTVRTCSRTQHANLFRLAIGGYGLFGPISRVELRLRPRVKVRRVVVMADTESIAERFEERIHSGYLYGDYQFATDSNRVSFLDRGVFSCYQPVAPDTPLTVNPTRFSDDDWAKLTRYSHTHKKLAFDMYSRRYLETSGQIYWADDQLSAAYVENYHADLDRELHAKVPGTEMITELYVPRAELAAFMSDARRMLRRRRASVIYGTIRMIERDDETFLAWARDRYACIVLNLHVDHTPRAVRKAAEAFTELIDLAISFGGSYYLTYHRWARKDQIERCYPQMNAFLDLKLHHDPGEVFQSSWYRHYRRMFRAERGVASDRERGHIHFQGTPVQPS